MASNGVKKQYSKFQILPTILPQKVILAVKSTLRWREADLNNKAYKLLKEDILKKFSPRTETAVERAMKRTFTDTWPARAIVHNIVQRSGSSIVNQVHKISLWQSGAS